MQGQPSRHGRRRPGQRAGREEHHGRRRRLAVSSLESQKKSVELDISTIEDYYCYLRPSKIVILIISF